MWGSDDEYAVPNEFDAAFQAEFRQRYGNNPCLDVSSAGDDPDDLLKPMLADGRRQKPVDSIWPVTVFDAVGDGGAVHRAGAGVLRNPTLFDLLAEMSLTLAEAVGEAGTLDSYTVYRHGEEGEHSYLFQGDDDDDDGEDEEVDKTKGASFFVEAAISEPPGGCDCCM